MADPQVEAWIEAHYDVLLRYATYQTFGDHDLATELLHLALAKVLEGRIKLDLSRSPKTFLQWAMRTSQRELMNTREILPVGLVTGLDEREDERSLINLLLPRLTAIQQDVLRRMQQGQSFHEIARQTGRRRQSISQHYWAAVKRLRALVRVRVGGGSGDDRERS